MSGAGPSLTLRLTPEVWQAIEQARPVVVLETSVLAQGLPVPHNRSAAEGMAGEVEANGATPAFAAVVDGQPTLGLTSTELERFLAREGVVKMSARDLAWVVAQKRTGATTVAATLALMHRSAPRVFATGGIGGVHRNAPFDESADLIELARTPAVVVCAGAKSILDLPATLERLETLGVPVIGYGTEEFPAFFCRSSGLRVPASVTTAEQVADIARAHWALGRREAIVVAQPVPEADALPRTLVDDAVRAALHGAAEAGITGAATTPWLLAAVERATNGQTLAANLSLLRANAGLAARIACALA